MVSIMNAVIRFAGPSYLASDSDSHSGSRLSSGNRKREPQYGRVRTGIILFAISCTNISVIEVTLRRLMTTLGRSAADERDATARASHNRIVWRHVTKCVAGPICGADLNGDNLWICVSVIKSRVRVCALFYSRWKKVTKCGSIT